MKHIQAIKSLFCKMLTNLNWYYAKHILTPDSWLLLSRLKHLQFKRLQPLQHQLNFKVYINYLIIISKKYKLLL
jgi:hypothetical protein